MFITRRKQSDLGLLNRLDPGYWHPGYDAFLECCVLPLAPLGEFIAHIRYGPIVTRQDLPDSVQARCAPQTRLWDAACTSEPTRIPVVHQGQVAETGVDLRQAVLVPAGSKWDHPQARLQPGDIVLPRSGCGSVARNRVAVFLADCQAVVGSFVNLVRLRDLDPVYVLLCLKTEIVWSQIHRLINGVGTPNISFDEIRSLRIPVAPEAVRAELRSRYMDLVHQPHLRWLASDERAGEKARRALRELVAQLQTLATGECR